MGTAQLQVLREEAMKEEREEIERIRKKYKERKKRISTIDTTNQERQALIQQAQKQEAIEKEQIRQKLKAKQKKGQLTTNTHTNQEKEQLIQQAQQQEAQEKEQLLKKYKERQKQHTQTQTSTINQEKQALIQQAQQQEAIEKEQIRQKFKQRQKQTTTPHNYNQKNEDPREEIVKELMETMDVMENTDVKEEFEKNEFLQEDTSDNQLLNNHFDDETYESKFERENLDIDEINEFNEEHGELDVVEKPITTIETEQSLEEPIETVKTVEKPITTIESEQSVEEPIETVKTVEETLETVEEALDRSALLAKFNIKDIQEDDVDQILENFDRPKFDENIEKIEERIMSKIEKSALAHPKIEWVNVLVFFDEEELEGNIKIFAEYSDRSLLKLIIPEDNKKLEVELIQIALYEVWDVLTTLGVIIDDLESKIDVEVELDRA